jgi:hypothetical protein
MRELTKREQVLAEFAAKAYDCFYFRNAELISRVGVVLFGAGILIPQTGAWRETLSTTGFGMLMLGITFQALSAAGKLYARTRELDTRNSRQS